MNDHDHNRRDTDGGDGGGGGDASITPVAPDALLTRDATAQAVSGDFRKFPVAADRLNAPPDDSATRRRVAIELLALGKSYVAVAKACDVTPRTVFNWRQDEAFRQQLSQRQQEIWQEAAARLRGLVHPALDIVERQLRDPYD